MLAEVFQAAGFRRRCAVKSVLASFIVPFCPAGGADPPPAFQKERERMVDEQMVRRGIRDPRVLAAMRTVPRDLFVPGGEKVMAYADRPLPIGHGQTISQPYIVAFMTEKLAPKPTDRVLEVGTGSGYQAAVLSRLVQEVYSVEIVPALAAWAEKALAEAGYDNVSVRAGDGYRGWPDKAPFDAIVVTAAPDHVPQPLVEQLKEGGRMAIPVGEEYSAQTLMIYTKSGGALKVTEELPVRFVPMTGEAQRR